VGPVKHLLLIGNDSRRILYYAHSTQYSLLVYCRDSLIVVDLLWDRYHVPQNVFLVKNSTVFWITFLLSEEVPQEDDPFVPLKKVH